jgi:hypothetical protein
MFEKLLLVLFWTFLAIGGFLLNWALGIAVILLSILLHIKESKINKILDKIDPKS